MNKFTLQERIESAYSAGVGTGDMSEYKTLQQQYVKTFKGWYQAAAELTANLLVYHKELGDIPVDYVVQ